MSRKILAGSVAALAIAGFSGFALARDALHTMTVRAPDGGTVTVRYTGDVAPQIAFGAAPRETGFAQFPSPFAMMERITAQMDRQMDAMLRETNALMVRMPDANPAIPAGFWNMPMGPSGLSAIAEGGKGSFCMKSMEITNTGDGRAPHVVTHTAGNCGSGAPSSSAPSHALQGTGPRTPI